MTDASFILAVGLMAVGAFATRAAGALLMKRITLTPKVERFLEGMAASVLAALVASQLVTSDIRNLAAVIVAMLTMLVTRSILWSMLTGMIAAALFPHLLAAWS